MNAVLRESVRPSRRLRRRPLGQLLIRSACVNTYATMHGLTLPKAADVLFDGDHGLRTYLSVQRAITDPALTSVPEWAANLASETWGEFVSTLGPDSVYSQLAQLGTNLTFAGGRVRVPTRNSTNKLPGDFVGENQPIPVRKGSLLGALLVPKKLAVLTAYSADMDGATGAQMEAILRPMLLEDTAQTVDARLLDSNAATALRPAGLLNGVTLTPSAGTSVADIVTDLKAAMAPVLLAGGGRRLVWLMNPLQAMSLSLQADAAGGLVWPDAGRRVGIANVIVSPNVPAGTVLLVDAAEFVTAADPAPAFEVSRDASLHMDDAATVITDTTMATPVVSLFQQDSLAIRMVQQMNWTMRRDGMVSGVTGIQW